MTDQPMPVRSKASMVVTPLARFQFNETLSNQCDKGLEKYGTPLRTFNSRDAHADALAELVDAVQYVTQARMEREEIVRRAQGMKLALERTLNNFHRALGRGVIRDATETLVEAESALAAWDELGLESEGE